MNLADSINNVYNLAIEARVRAGMIQTDCRRHNLARTRRAQRLAVQLARIAADLASAAFQASDLLDAEVRRLRNRCEE